MKINDVHYKKLQSAIYIKAHELLPNDAEVIGIRQDWNTKRITVLYEVNKKQYRSEIAFPTGHEIKRWRNE